MTSGILVVNRLAFFRRIAQKGRIGTRSLPLGFTAEDIFMRYRGFDGDAWPSLDTGTFVREDGLASTDDWPSVRQYMIGKDECDAIVLTDVDGKTPIEGWVRLGVDLGYFQSPWSHYSAVLNEILFGTQPDLRCYTERLNADLLFVTMDECRAALAARNDLRSRGADLESEEVGPIVVFAPGEMSAKAP